MTLLQQREGVERAVETVRARWGGTPAVAMVLGTGLGGAGNEIEVEVEIPYHEIPGFPVATVESHGGRLLLGHWQGVPVAAMSGRFHRYEGYSLQEVTLPIRVLRLLGAPVLFLSGAVGGMNPLWGPGELVMLDDHINLLGDSPLVGPNVDEWGPRFPDMSQVYDRDLQDRAGGAALALGIPLHRGVYVAVTGPNLETRAEYRMLRMMGADVVGMSTVPEALVARQMGMRILAITVITDHCLPDALEPTDVQTIIRIAGEAEPRLTAVFRSVVAGFRGNNE
jgi:purine-nucleoside phosphorylase